MMGTLQPASSRRFFDDGNRGGSFGDVDGPANQFGASFGEFQGLLQGGFHVGGVRVGHGLHDDGCATAHADVSDVYAVGFAARGV